MGILGARVITKAKVEAEQFSVDAIVTNKYITYRIAAVKQPEADDFGPFREIVIEGYNAWCSASFFSPCRIIKLDYRTMEEITQAVNTGDFVRSYLVVLDHILSGVSLEIALNPYSEKKPEMERHISILSKIKNNLEKSKIVEDPIMVMKRLQSTVMDRI